MLFLDGVYIQSDEGKLRFRQIAPPTTKELQVLLHSIAQRVAVGPQQGKKVFSRQILG